MRKSGFSHVSPLILHEIAPYRAWKHSGFRNFILRRGSHSSLNMRILMSNFKKWVFVNIYANTEQNQFHFGLRKLFISSLGYMVIFFMEYMHTVIFNSFLMFLIYIKCLAILSVIAEFTARMVQTNTCNTI
jgi:hypothetical protein